MAKNQTNCIKSLSLCTEKKEPTTKNERKMALRQMANSSWSFTLGATSIVPNTLGFPNYKWLPDSHIAVLKDLDIAVNATEDSSYIMFWPDFMNQ
jgi:hypothetical protein